MTVVGHLAGSLPRRNFNGPSDGGFGPACAGAHREVDDAPTPELRMPSSVQLGAVLRSD
jgi:hypothetical protein